MVDGLVNNAGVERFGAVEETPLTEFRRCMETNYFGALRCIQAVAPGMRSRGHGTIVNVSSVAGKISVAPMAPYAASKSALEAMSEVLAQEMKAFGVRVAIVEPGIIDTRMARNIEALPPSTSFPHMKRISALFNASLAAKPPLRLWSRKKSAKSSKAVRGNSAMRQAQTRSPSSDGAPR